MIDCYTRWIAERRWSEEWWKQRLDEQRRQHDDENAAIRIVVGPGRVPGFAVHTECPRDYLIVDEFQAWTENWVYFLSVSEGELCLESVARNPPAVEV